MAKINAYYYKVVKRMDIKDFNKQVKIEKHECLFDENKHSEYFEETYFDRNLTGWIELIENPKLHNAVKQLSVEDQIFISYIFKESKTQEETAQIYNVTHQNISKKLKVILDKLRKIF